MANGVSQAIELVQVGDEVLSQSGSVNRVIGLEPALLGDRFLYAFNDGPFFVTPDHPFMTETGWKAINPIAAAARVPSISISTLKVGDRILSLASVLSPVGVGAREVCEPLEITIASQELTEIRVLISDAATPVYNLKVDGDHVYFANEWMVHNKP